MEHDLELTIDLIQYNPEGAIYCDASAVFTAYARKKRYRFGVTQMPDAVKANEDASLTNCIVWTNNEEEQVVFKMQELINACATVMTHIDDWRQEQLAKVAEGTRLPNEATGTQAHGC